MKTTASISHQTKLAVVTTIVLWASAFVGIRISLESYSPGALALFRFLIASACLYVICLYLPNKKKMPWRHQCILFLIGAATVGGYHIALNYGEIAVSSGIASFIISQSPVFTIIFAVLFFNERLHYLGVIGMLISIFGVTLILVSHPNELNFTIGGIEVLVAAFLGSLYHLLQKSYLKIYHPIIVTSYLVWGATLLLLIFTKPLLQEVFHASLIATSSVIYLGVFPAAIAYLTWGYVLTKIPASRAVNFLYGMPFIATLLGWLLLNEKPALLALVGGVLALVGVWILNHSYSKLTKPVLIEEQAITQK